MTEGARAIRRAVAAERRGTCSCCGSEITHVGEDPDTTTVVAGCRWLVGAWVRDPEVIARIPVGPQRAANDNEKRPPLRYTPKRKPTTDDEVS